MFTKIYIILILSSLIYAQPDECYNGRYLDEIFDVEVEYEVQYGQNINQTILGSEITENLFMNIYKPINDDLSDRPLVFFMFGGSYVSGSKESSDIVAMCMKYASRGYVAVAIDYRLSQHLLLFNPNEENAYKAVFKAVHDLKAAIRYFRMNDALYNDYKIDVNRIFAGGYSAGYYSYKWAEIMSSDAFGAFEEINLDDKKKIAELGKKFRETILAKGGGEHPAEVFRQFRGRDTNPDALLRHNGLV